MKRIEYIDAMRGFTMILVVLAHVINFSYGINDEALFDFPTFNNLFVRFRMPLFFFVSGFVLYKPAILSTYGQRFAFLGSKFLVQIVPTMLFLALFCYTFHFGFVDALMGTMKQGYWFTIALFEFFVLFCVLRPITKSERYGGVILIALSLIVYAAVMALKMYEQQHGMVAPASCLGVAHLRFFVFFALGYAVRQHFERVCRWLDNKYVITVAILLLATSFLILSPLFPAKLYNTLMFVPDGLLGVLIVFAFFRRHEARFTQATRLGRTLQYIGRRTLDVYLLHYFFLPRQLDMVGEWLQTNNNPVLEFFLSLTIAILVVAICLVASNLLRLSPILARVLFGVKQK